MNNFSNRFSLFLILISFQVATTQDTYNLWSSIEKPFSKDNNIQEKEEAMWGTFAVLQVVNPTLTVYPAQGDNSGKSVIIIPGGGYEAVGIYHEGSEVAEMLAARGITAAVLKYRIPSPSTSDQPHKVPLADARRSMVLLRNMSGKYGLEKDQLGLVGFSAGGHLASVASVWKSKRKEENPNFSAMIYGVTNLSPGNRKWLESNLYHREMTAEEVKENTLLDLVSSETPPAFLAHAYNDNMCKVEETTLYADKLRANGVLVETHIFSKGGHGFGVGSKDTGTDQWINLFVNWIKSNDF